MKADPIWPIRQSELSAYKQVVAYAGALMDSCDYQRGACRINESIGAVIPALLLENLREALHNVRTKGGAS